VIDGIPAGVAVYKLIKITDLHDVAALVTQAPGNTDEQTILRKPAFAPPVGTVQIRFRSPIRRYVA
jgi:hypothetical protein